MSGILSAIEAVGGSVLTGAEDIGSIASGFSSGGILGAISSIGNLFGGHGLVTLGPVKFTGIEVPEFIPLGGAQAMHVVKNPGGERIIQAMGRDDADMSWSGYLEGPQAESRMQLLDSVRQSGAEITLAFGQSSFQVVVSSFSAEYHRRNWIPYKVTVTVLADNAAAKTKKTPSLLDSLNNDIKKATGIDIGAGLSSLNNDIASATGFNVATTITSLSGDVGGLSGLVSDASAAMSVAQSAVNVAGALGLNTGSWTSAISSLTTAQYALTGVQSLAENGISGIVDAAGTFGNILGVPQVGNAAASLSTLANTVGILASTVQTAPFIGRAIKNLAGASA